MHLTNKQKIINSTVKTYFLNTTIVKCFVLCVLALQACNTVQRVPYNVYKKYSVPQLQQELGLLQTILQTDHPSLYWYTPKPQMDSVFAAAKLKITDSLTEWQYRKIVSQAVANIKCGHTSVRGSKQFDKWFATSKLANFPIGARVYNDTIVSTYNLYRKDTILPRGSVITSINGVSSKKIVDSLCTIITTDGNSKNFKYMRLSGNFPYYYSYVFDTAMRYIINYTDSTNAEKTVTTYLYRQPPKDTTKRIQISGIGTVVKVQKPSKKDLQQLKLASIRNVFYSKDSATATLTVNSFSGGKQKKFYRKTFKKIKAIGCKNIIIDVRNNGGGIIGNSSLLSRYIINTPRKVADSIFAVRQFSKHNKYIKNRVWYGLSMIFVTHKKNDGRYHFGYFERHKDKPKRNNHFDGKVVVISGGYSFSATTLFLHAIQGQKNVTTVGETTGGGAYGNSAVYIPDITLPYTKLRVRLPVFRLVMDKNLPHLGQGITPDVLVMPTVKAIANGQDNKMEKALELIKD